MKPIISVIVPIYNEENYIIRCIESLLNQTIASIEIILVDDGSTDATASICDSYSSNYDNVRVIHKKNEGQGKARNTGLDVATGEWVGFVDADDFVESTMYQELYNLANDKKSEMVSCLMSSNSSCNTKSSNYMEYRGKDGIAYLAFGMVGMKPHIEQDMIFGMSVCRSIFKLDIIKQYNIKFESEREVSSEDLLFNLEYLKHINYMIYSSKQLYHYCYNASSTTHTFKKDSFEKDKKLLEIIRNTLTDFGTEEDANESADRMLLTRVRINILNCTYSIKTLGFFGVYGILHKYVNDKEVRKVIRRYPGKLLKGNRKLVFYLIKYHLTFLLFLASYIFGKRNKRI